jgi:hypothetical protein
MASKPEEHGDGPVARDQALAKAYRRAWILVLVGLAYSLGFTLLALGSNLPERAPTWDMGGKPFVPASSPFANGYPLPFEQAGTPPPRR